MGSAAGQITGNLHSCSVGAENLGKKQSKVSALSNASKASLQPALCLSATRTGHSLLGWVTGMLYSVPAKIGPPWCSEALLPPPHGDRASEMLCSQGCCPGPVTSQAKLPPCFLGGWHAVVGSEEGFLLSDYPLLS